MIWDGKLSASLELYRIELTRTQHLAQTLADKLNSLIEEREKSLDLKVGISSGWNDRADGAKGDKRGQQTQGRMGRGERNRGGARGMFFNPRYTIVTYFATDGARRGRGARFAQGLGSQMAETQRNHSIMLRSRTLNCHGLYQQFRLYIHPEV